MNVTTICGFLTAFLVVYEGVIHPSPKPELFINAHAIILVLGGTAAAAMIAFPAMRLINLMKILGFSILFKTSAQHRDIIVELIGAATAYLQNPTEIKKRKVPHPFLGEGYHLIAEGFLKEEELRDVLQRRAKYFKRSLSDDAKLLGSLAKFPPAFGLLGATSGMIIMMTNLGKGGQDSIGPSMAVALVATFWGIALANLILLPLADFATKIADEDFVTRQLIIEGLMLIIQKQSDLVIVEKLNSYLNVNERIQMQVDIENKKDGTSFINKAS